jgi:MerR family copper efflux transcriptional regulator
MRFSTVARILQTAASMDQNTPLSSATPSSVSSPMSSTMSSTSSAQTESSSLFPIGELTRRTGTTKRVVEHAEVKGLLRPAGRTSAGHKLYSQAEEETLRLIVRLYALGFSANRIKALFTEPAERIEALFDEHQRFLQGRVEDARRRVETYERERAAVCQSIEAYRLNTQASQASDTASPAAAPAPTTTGTAQGGANEASEGLAAPRARRQPGKQMVTAA